VGQIPRSIERISSHIMGPMGRIKHDAMFRRVRQVAVPVGRQTNTAFGRVRENAAPGAKSAIYDYDCLVIFAFLLAAVFIWVYYLCHGWRRLGFESYLFVCSSFFSLARQLRKFWINFRPVLKIGRLCIGEE